MSDVPNIIDEIYDQYRYHFLNENKSNKFKNNAFRHADQIRDLEYASAVTIQSWFRGTRVRSYYK
jgi:hypothetical protein